MQTDSHPSSLAGVLAGLAEVAPELDRKLVGICADSRQVQPGCLFLALSGERHHGLDFYPQVRAAGAVAVAYEPDARHPKSLPQQNECPLIAVEQLGAKAALIADRYYESPSRQLRLVGVTGTDGKTSVASFLAQCLTAADNAKPCGLLGTLGYGVWGELAAADLTTPDAVTIRRCLAAIVESGSRYAAMEVSSHALAQGRVDGLRFAVAVLTNLTRDHLDYHGDAEAYAGAKRRLFNDLQPTAAVLNMDDPFGRALLPLVAAPVYGYGMTGERPMLERYVWAVTVSPDASGLTIEVDSSHGQGTIRSVLLGRFNAANLVAVLAALLALDVPFAQALAAARGVRTAPGRMERFGGRDGLPLAVVDYAHTPHALLQALKALREHTGGRLWCVFGCGGDRDAGKRALMAANAESWSDRVIVTNDNPRDEEPSVIAGQIMQGFTRPEAVTVELDRAAAIERALAAAGPDDVVLIAGKGHEDYQLLAGRRIPFSDRELVRRTLGAAA